MRATAICATVLLIGGWYVGATTEAAPGLRPLSGQELQIRGLDCTGPKHSHMTKCSGSSGMPECTTDHFECDSGTHQCQDTGGGANNPTCETYTRYLGPYTSCIEGSDFEGACQDSEPQPCFESYKCTCSKNWTDECDCGAYLTATTSADIVACPCE